MRLDEDLSAFAEAVEAQSKQFTEMRQGLCRKHDALISALKDDNKRQLRNAMDDLSLCVQAIALFEGCVDVEPLAANYSTLDRYIP